MWEGVLFWVLDLCDSLLGQLGFLVFGVSERVLVVWKKDLEVLEEQIIKNKFDYFFFINNQFNIYFY